MHTAVDAQAGQDVTDVPSIVRGAVKLGLLEAVLVLLFSLASRLLPAGPTETVVLALLLMPGLAAVAFLPGHWTRARTIEGIAGATGIGLGAAFVFLLVDVSLLQNIGTYSHRWLALGGGSNWWYHPVWWMVGAFLPWMGAWVLANQAARRDGVSLRAAAVTALLFTIAAASAAVLLKVPGAHWTLATFGVAFLPGLALAAAFSARGPRHG